MSPADPNPSVSPDPASSRIEAARMVLPCADLEKTLEWFTERLGFRLEAIYPADEPTVGVIAGHGLRIQLDRGETGPPGRIRLLCRDPGLAQTLGSETLEAPNGTRVDLAEADPKVEMPDFAEAFVISRASGDSAWVIGRAGMLYRDLVPGRLGGAVIASHIRIPEGGPVPDYVHYHKVRFQMIYCYRGWVRLVYEDQGPPFVLEAGDCVLQPPRIRHRVLECSPGLEVIELGCPAEHETFACYEVELPTGDHYPGRLFEGQRFVRHVAAEASWRPHRLAGFAARDTGIAEATAGVAGASVARHRSGAAGQTVRHGADLLFTFVLEGSLALAWGGRAPASLGPGDAFVIPKGSGVSYSESSEDLELLEVSLPGAFETEPAHST